MNKPSIGRIVIAAILPEMNNGSGEAPAIITRVWGQRPDGGWTVNIRIFPDNPGSEIVATSVHLTEEKPEGAPAHGRACWWPPRV